MKTGQVIRNYKRIKINKLKADDYKLITTKHYFKCHLINYSQNFIIRR